MKHIYKIVKTSLLLKKRFDWDEGQITMFIKHILFAQDYLQDFNEMYANTPSKDVPINILEEVIKFKNDIRTYLEKQGINDVQFSTNPMEVPIHMNLGLINANHKNGVSFVIDL